MAVRRQLPRSHPACVTPRSVPTGQRRVDDASLGIKQRERRKLLVWQLLFCRLFNESAYRHLGLQFFNLFACRNPTSPGEDALEADVIYSLSCFFIISHYFTNNKYWSSNFQSFIDAFGGGEVGGGEDTSRSA